MSEWLSARLERLEKLHARELAGMAADDERDSLAPTPDYSIGPLHDPTVEDTCSCDEAVALRARVAELEAALTARHPDWLELIHWRSVAATTARGGAQSTAPIVHFMNRATRAERRATLWHKLARMKHRLLHVNDYERADSQLVRPVQGG